ncbi:MAG: response regulator, partial [Rhodothermaceae bacterium]|nr:response regulator [Rhodothermaceae bacterium]
IRIGLIVHSVNRIHRISWEEVKPPEAIDSIDPASSTVVGIVNQDDKTILMIDVEKIVADVNTELALSASNLDLDTFGSNYTVVTAEDSSMIRRLIVNELDKVGFNIKSLNDGLSAWKHLARVRDKVRSGERLKDHVNLIITDIEMPQMDGYTLIKNIKEDEILRDLPVIIFSSMITEDNRHKGKSVGANAQLTKPEIGKLLETSKELLGFERDSLGV